MADDAQNALCALREATAALVQATTLSAGREHGTDGTTGTNGTVLVADLARNLEALAALVRTTTRGPLPTTPAGDDLLAVVQGISVTAAMARRAASPGDDPVPHLAASRAATAPDD
ncbi:hypothetical protein ACQPX6_27665 [Actinomycetospora sp. CA-101289]|uniref:hypothetical protein n=1 Tax=Actinomycetospora sp. CA-101289 TaxID=3239893 RepID=UPI003D9682D0